ncbi:MAG: hypothetical protein CMI13_06390 [Oleibacter sp.]|nr:hypothetical protein [Thalassolituus sp.]
MTNRTLYQADVKTFLNTKPNEVIGSLARGHRQELVHEQTNAWISQIELLQQELRIFPDAYVLFEYSIPRMGKRIDTLIFYKGLIFVLEFKVGEYSFKSADKRQLMDYCLDLSLFHEESSKRLIIPILVATNAKNEEWKHNGISRSILAPILSNGDNLESIISSISEQYPTYNNLDFLTWLYSPYRPVPSIVEAARALYANNQVDDILRSDAGAENLNKTTNVIKSIIHHCNEHGEKAICFVTGVPGAGKTLVGLNIATDKDRVAEERAVYLSGNGPLVKVLREALIRDRKSQKTITETTEQEVHTSIQNIHHFRKHYMGSLECPDEQVVIFDEAQRAWNSTKLQQADSNFTGSEADFLIGVMDRQSDWTVIIALVGEGQEINDGEAGLESWVEALTRNYPHWKAYYSSELLLNDKLKGSLIHNFDRDIFCKDSLHLTSSIRSLRASNLSDFVGHLVDGDAAKAKIEYEKIQDRYPLAITRNFNLAKDWIRKSHEGNERMGLLSSSSAKRLRAVGIFNSIETDETKWFLEPEGDVRSSNALEEAVSEFKVQGLELDWALIGWDADYRYDGLEFEHFKFSGSKWQRRRLEESQVYLKNAYRVLLTRARLGMVIYVPIGDEEDETRKPEFYNKTYEYLSLCGLPELKDSEQSYRD